MTSNPYAPPEEPIEAELIPEGIRKCAECERLKAFIGVLLLLVVFLAITTAVFFIGYRGSQGVVDSLLSSTTKQPPSAGLSGKFFP